MRMTQLDVDYNTNLWVLRINYPANSCSKSPKETLDKKCEIYLKLTIKTPEQCQWGWSGVFIVNFEHILHIFLGFLLQVNVRWIINMLTHQRHG